MIKRYEWDQLIYSIKQCEVVPVLGPELLVSKDENGQLIPFYRAVVKKIAQKLEFPAEENESVSDYYTRWHSRTNGNRGDFVFLYIQAIIELGKTSEQPFLEKLIEINSFPLFLTTTPDMLLANTLEKYTTEKPVECAFIASNKSTSRNIDLDLPKEGYWDNEKHYIFYLFGKAQEQALDFAITADDRLRYSCAWFASSLLNSDQASGKIPATRKNLFSYLSDKRLLILGCGFEDWQTRFFLYGLKICNQETHEQIVHQWKIDSIHADSCSCVNPDLEFYLSSRQSKIYNGSDTISSEANKNSAMDTKKCDEHDSASSKGGEDCSAAYSNCAIEFINELCERIQKANPSNTLLVSDSKYKNTLPVSDSKYKYDVFISYAGEDIEIAKKICESLREHDINEIFFDKDILKDDPGTDWGKKLKNAIEESCVFIAVLSQNTEAISRRNFRQEWIWAKPEDEKSHPTKAPFVHPILIDGSKKSLKDLEDVIGRKMEYKWAALKGELDSGFFDGLKRHIQLMREGKKI